jgi:hypothetical protein
MRRILMQAQQILWSMLAELVRVQSPLYEYSYLDSMREDARELHVDHSCFPAPFIRHASR